MAILYSSLFCAVIHFSFQKSFNALAVSMRSIATVVAHSSKCFTLLKRLHMTVRMNVTTYLKGHGKYFSIVPTSSPKLSSKVNKTAFAPASKVYAT